ncbi:alpha/beta fold hydrolase [Calidifontimicrobium sp. SYSU G02091]|uniref:alpha/beta hydrolase n=1 Tax=Calidifontimicrobium sp. SYSU G02091 TaxID=2926421 RepID=UPI001F53C42A|nr:alpha/beta fold hydrolase [Calidifontimicrobium sp. SYSU G02091]MCI1190792.1 alpha/beta fold hydrolase [Calidifontimicrobium sp. SYSU G02091]
MNASAERRVVAGPAGAIECVIEELAVATRGVAVLCHPHPLHGGTMDNKVVQTLARALRQVGWRTVRFNFRGVGHSQGQWDAGRGEVDDALAVVAAVRDPALPLVLGGFSFGGYVAAQAARRVDPPAARLVLVAPATGNFDVGAVPDDTLVVHGDADDVVPLAATLAWARPQALPVVVVPGVGHFFHGQLPLLKSIVVRAFAA